MSLSAFGVLPAGNDTTGTGTIAAPYATLVKALTVVAEGGQIVLNGDPASPSLYPATTLYNITKGMKIDAVYPYGATLQATGAQTRVINCAPTAGQTIRLGKIIVDGTNTIANCVLITDQATTFTFNAIGTKFINWTTQGVSCSTSATATKANILLDGCSLLGGSVRSGIYFIGHIAGSIVVRNSSIIVTSQNISGHGGCFAQALATGVTTSFTNNYMNIALDTGTTGTTFGYRVFNIPNAVITGNTFSVSGPANGRSFEVVQVVANAAAPLDTSGAYIAFNNFLHDCNGGMCIELGEDGQDTGSRGFQNGAIIERNTVTGTAKSQAGSLHGIFNGSGGNSILRYNYITTVGYCLLDKEGDGSRAYNNICIEAAINHLRLKGSKNEKWSHNTLVRTTAVIGPMCFATNNQTNSHAGSGGVVSGNIFYATATTDMISSDATEGVSYDHNDYFSTVALDSNPFINAGVNYADVPAWRAVEGSAIAVNPQFLNAAGANYDIGHGASALDIVPVDVGVPNDYLARVFANPATVGAYQRQ